MDGYTDWGSHYHGIENDQHEEVFGEGSPSQEDAAFIAAACNAFPALVLALEQAVARIELENEEEGNPILSAWLPEARAALALAKAL